MPSEIVYSLKNLKHSYGRHPTLDIESLDIPRGSVVGLVGPNGSGKSTLLKIMAFLESCASGELLFEGSLASGRERELRRKATLLLQEPWLLRRSVYENVAYGLKLRGFPDGNETEGRVCDALSRVGLDPELFVLRPWHRLSGGEAQRVALAARLALQPTVLLLDEPTANVDEASSALIREAVLDAWRRLGTTVVVATHDLSWLHEVATQIVSLHRGRVVGDGTENLLQGEWRSNGAYLELRAGERIIRAKTCGKSDFAFLSPSRVTFVSNPSESTDAENVLDGVLTQMSFERASGKILCTVDCKCLTLRARVSPEAAQRMNLCPGRAVCLTFAADAVRFL